MSSKEIEESSNKFHGLTWSEVTIPMRDGLCLAANLYRPDTPGRFPVILSICPYGKDLHFTEFGPKNPTIRQEYAHSQDKGPLLSWETANPDYWVPHGYAVLRIDERGIGRSPGKLDILSAGLKQDYHDAIEWAGVQGWSSGKVGLLGISYLAISQWGVATLKPPHLTCIVPWEGAVDLYAEFTYPGGMLANGFIDFWWANGVLPNQHNPGGKLTQEELANNRVDFPRAVRQHPLRDESWAARSADISKIEVPFLSASNWFSAGIHTRGNFLAFQHAPAEHKWLEVHLGSHVGQFYTIEGRELQRRFLDTWLKELDTGLMHESRVKLAIPTGGRGYFWRYENEYPLARTDWQTFALHADTLTLSQDRPGVGSSVRFEGDHDRESKGFGRPYMVKPFAADEENAKRVLFRTAPFTADTELLGPIKLRLWASSSSDDMDVFVSLRHIGADGAEITYEGANARNYPVSQGWLKASLRHLDPRRSTPEKPIYTFDRVEKLAPGVPYPLEIELWDSAAAIPAGDCLILEIGSQNQSGAGLQLQNADDRAWEADVTIHTGGEFDSHLLLPIIPGSHGG